ncbi:MAG: SDR family oxidoreductase [Candidatus Krumholzibacteriia bacterium]
MNRTALITGAGGGLAQATARLLAEAGWSLALVGRDRQALEAVHQDLTRQAPQPAESIKIVLVKADVSTGEGAVSAVETARELLGEPIGGLVNCAGGVFLQPGHQTTEAQYRDVIAANLDTAFFSLGAYVEQALADKVHGSIVLVSSVAARVGVPRHEALAAAKGGVEALVRSAAATYAPRGLRVNGVAPGLMRTPATETFFGNPAMEKALAEQYPLGRWGDVLDTARAIRWLLGDEASWVTGQIVPVDGGFTGARTLPRAGARA